MLKRLIAVSLLVPALAAISCSKSETTTSTDTTATQSTTTTATSSAAATPPAAEPVSFRDGLQTPESVLYDADQDVYFISNINGAPLAIDHNGYISRVNAETLKVDPKWIDGSKAGGTLNAPKGMAIVGDDLYVADINTVRKFDRKSGAPKGEIPLKGTTFLNDLVADGNSVYVSDSGLDAAFKTTKTDAIWKITGNKGEKIASGAELKAPNGLAMMNGKLWVVSFAGKELYPLENGKKGTPTLLPAGSLDGLVAMSDGSFLVSSWDSKSVYRGQPGGTFTQIIQNVDSPADIGYDAKRNRLLVPHFMESRITVHPLQ